MKYYLLFLILIIMGAGAYTMFEIAYQAMSQEHGATPGRETTILILLTLWFIIMMVFDVILLSKKELPYRNIFIGLLSLGILTPAVYMFFFHKFVA